MIDWFYFDNNKGSIWQWNASQHISGITSKYQIFENFAIYKVVAMDYTRAFERSCKHKDAGGAAHDEGEVRNDDEKMRWFWING